VEANGGGSLCLQDGMSLSERASCARRLSILALEQPAPARPIRARAIFNGALLMTKLPIFLATAAVLAFASPASAQTMGKVGALSCDVSAGIGMIIMEKQTMICTFTPNKPGQPERYTGKIDEYGVAIGEVAAGRLVWAVIAAASGVPHGALAGTYAGAGADAAVGAGLGANILMGGSGRAFSLQPLSVEGEVGVNIAAGVTTVTLVSAP
jgi:hypothetical protein